MSTPFEDAVAAANVAKEYGDSLIAEVEAQGLEIDQLNLKVDAQEITINDLQRQLDECQNGEPAPTGHVIVGVNDRFYSDFSSKVIAHKCQRMYAEVADVTGGAWPKAKAAAAGGQRVFISVKRADPAHLTKVHDFVKTFATRPELDYYHEPEDNVESGAFTAAQYVASARAFYTALHDVADIGWCPMAWSFTQGAPAARQALVKSLYPGDEFVDIIAADGYVRDSAAQTFPKVFSPWVAWALPHSKPMAILEWGVNELLTGMTADLRATKTSEFFEYVRSVPQITAVCLWESSTTKEGVTRDYQIRDDPKPRDAYKAKAQDPYFQLPPG